VEIEHKIEWDDAKIARLWNYYAKTSGTRDLYFSHSHGRAVLRRSRLPRRKTLAILDFGCGPGFMWDHVLDASPKWGYTGLDFSPESIAALKTRCGGHPQFRGALAVSKLPSELADASFDVILLIEVVEHLRDDALAATLTELRRLLKPGGLVVVTTPNDEDLPVLHKFCPECGAVFHEWQHVRSWSANSLCALFQEYGFTARHVLCTDLGATSPLRWVISMLRRHLRGAEGAPHLVAVFGRQ